MSDQSNDKSRASGSFANNVDPQKGPSGKSGFSDAAKGVDQSKNMTGGSQNTGDKANADHNYKGDGRIFASKDEKKQEVLSGGKREADRLDRTGDRQNSQQNQSHGRKTGHDFSR